MSWIREAWEEAGKEEGAGLDNIRGHGSEINFLLLESNKLVTNLYNIFLHAFDISILIYRGTSACLCERRKY